MVKDTLFLEKECRKVNVEEYDPDGDLIDQYSFFIYDEDEKVYISCQDNFELLLYFGLSVGDTLKYST